MSAAPARLSNHREQYQGKNLVRLLLAIALPAGLLYLRIVLGTVASYSRTITTAQIGQLSAASNLVLAAFCVVQLLCANYIQRLAPPRRTRAGQWLQFAAVLLLCLFLSVTGAVILEAFGYNLLIRSGRT